MANGSFSAQLQQAQAQQEQGKRISRTQRVQATEQEERAKYNFEQLSKEAERLKNTEFSNITFEEYKIKYAKLSPDLQQFFQTPQQIMEAQEKAKQEQRDQLQSRIDIYQQKVISAKQRIEDYRRWWDGLRQREQESRIEDYRRGMEDRERDLDEAEETISYAQGEAGKIDAGATASDIWNYAQDKADYNRERREAKGKAIREFNESVKTGKLDQDLLKLGLSKTATYEQFASKVESYNKDVAYMQQLQKWSSNVGYANLPQWTKEKLNLPAQEWQKKYPTEVLQFDKSGNVVAVKSTQFAGKTYSIEEYNKRIETLSGIDTSLKLGEKKEVSKPVSMISAGFVPFTKEQIRLNEYYSEKSLLQKGFDWVKTTLKLDKVDTTPPKIETVTTKTAPTGTGGKGTAIIKTEFAPETALYVGELMEYNQKANKLSEQIFVDYEKKISEMEVISKEKIEVLKTEKQKTFEEQIGKYGYEFEKDYTAGMEKIKREKKWMVEETPLGLAVSPLRSWYYKLEDQEKKLAGTIKTPSQTEIETEALKDFSYYREKKMPKWLARELAGGEEFGKGIYYGGKVAIKEHPKTVLFRTGMWAGATATVMVVSSYTGGFGGVATAPALKWALTGAGLLYGGTVVARVSAPSTAYERGKRLGTIGGEEILPMLAGGIAGSYIGGRAIAGIDYAYYKWIKKYPYRTSYKLTEMQILRGEKKFPEISPHGKSAQLKAFKKLDAQFLTPDERALIKSGGKLKLIGTHGTPERMAFVKDTTQIKAIGREINAMSLSNKRWSIHFARANLKQRYSIYSGQAIPTGAMPLGLRVEMQGVKAFPSKFKPKLKLTELQKILGYKINPKDFKYTAYLYEKGYYGTGYVAGLKPEIEMYAKGGGDLKRLLKQKYYTQLASEKFYQRLTGFQRKGFQEYALRVEKFAVLKSSTWIDKIIGRQAGAFKPMTKGRVIPYERFEALTTGDKDLAKQIKALLSTKKPRAEVVNLLKEKQLMQTSKAVSVSSEIIPYKISASYPSSYAVQYLLSSKISKAISPSVSYAKSYEKSYKYSAPSSLKSAISSLISYQKPSGVSVPSYPSLPSKPSFPSYPSVPSYPSYPKLPRYYLPKLFKTEKLKERLRRKFRITPEIQGLFPDFTARAIGLAPKQVSLKQAMREIAKLQTGFEIRTGARIKGYKPIDERNLMRGIMA
jgi:hypothetical protein